MNDKQINFRIHNVRRSENEKNQHRINRHEKRMENIREYGEDFFQFVFYYYPNNLKKYTIDVIVKPIITTGS